MEHLLVFPSRRDRRLIENQEPCFLCLVEASRLCRTGKAFFSINSLAKRRTVLGAFSVI